jgi:hypothetical protein
MYYFQYKKLQLSFYLLYFIISFASAYGKLGHYVIGQVVYNKLSNETKSKINNCGYLDSFNGNMGNASLWADMIKRNPKYRWTSALHYYDVDNDPPSFCGYVEEPPNARAHNLMNGLARAIKNLTCDSSYILSNVPLHNVCCGSFFHFNMYLHLIQDLYQPLHLTGKDRGGNNKIFEKNGKKYNLHHYWDSIALDLLMTDVHPNYTMQDAVVYFFNYSKRHRFADSCRTRTRTTTTTNIISYIYKEANSISNENCNIVWDTDKDDYIEQSKIIVRTLILRSIHTLQCLLEFVMS